MNKMVALPKEMWYLYGITLYAKYDYAVPDDVAIGSGKPKATNGTS